MRQGVCPADPPLPLATAALANIALALLMWDVLLRLGFFLARCCAAGAL
ncbi:MAG: hypothetical protein ACREFH_00755 [Stellaceae bacterium]